MEGSWPLRVLVRDAAGNDLAEDGGPAELLVRLDFSPPVATCQLDERETPLGETIRLRAGFDEPLAAPPRLRAVVTEPPHAAGDELGFGTLIDPSEAGDPTPGWVYTYTPLEPGPFDLDWSYEVFAVDLAGNRALQPDEPAEEAALCQGDGRIDQTPIGVSTSAGVDLVEVDYDDPETGEHLVTGLHARDGSLVTVRFELDAEPAPDTLSVRLGEMELVGHPDVAAQVTPDGTGGSTHVYAYTLAVGGPGGLGEGPLPVRLEVADPAGNVTLEPLGTLEVDGTAPSTVGQPYFTRCDEREAARVAADELWVAADPGCAPAEAVVRVRFTLSEPCLAAALPLVRVGDRPLVPIEGQPGGSDFVYGYHVSEDRSEPRTDSAQPLALGTVVTAELRDRAGNAASLLLGRLRFDFEAPAALAAARQELVELFRAPWGSDDTCGRVRVELRACPSPPPEERAGDCEASAATWDWCPEGEQTAFERGALVTAYRTTVDEAGQRVCPEVGDVLARAATDVETGRLTLEIGGDWPAVCVGQTDPAGNESAPALVDNVEWVATLGRKVVGSEIENPHRFELLGRSDAYLVHGAAPATAGGAALSTVDAASAVTRAEGTWRLRTHANPEARWDGGGAWDGARGRLLLFGGRRADHSKLGDTWAWDGLGWTRVIPEGAAGDTSPPARARHAMAYDGGRDRILLQGGGEEVTRALWEWDGEAWALTRVDDPGGGARPFSASGRGMVYRAASDRIFLYGGGGASYGWEWDGVGWTITHPADPEGDGAPPEGIWDLGLAYDAVRERAVLFGGRTASRGEDLVLGETWEWDGTSWALVEPGDPEQGDPPAREGHALVWDAARERLVLFGGHALDGLVPIPLDETWERHGTTWSLVEPEDPEGDGSPAARSGHVMAWDATRREVVLHGGCGAWRDDAPCNRLRCGGCALVYGDTWAWNGTSWALRSAIAEGAEQPRAGRVPMAWSEAEERLLLLTHEGTWEWDGLGWRLALAGGHPMVTDRSRLAYDPVRERVVHFGRDGTWELEPEGWLQHAVAEDGPPALGRQDMVWDGSGGRVLLFGGALDTWEGVGETWGWDGASWTLRAAADPAGAAAPGPRYGYGWASDPERGRVVLFGGLTSDGEGDTRYFGDTWEWDGERWEERTPEDPEEDGDPPALAYPSMTWDGRRGRVVLFGGDATLSPASDTWEWDGTSWALATPRDLDGDGNPPGRNAAAFVYDPRCRASVLRGGYISATDFDDTWEWDGGAGSRPAHLLRAVVSAARLPEVPRWQSLRVLFVAGGHGSHEGAPRSGARLAAWARGAWTELASRDDGLDEAGAPRLGQLEWRTDDADVIDSLLLGADQAMSFGVSPTADRGRGEGRILTDYAELRLRYRH